MLVKSIVTLPGFAVNDVVLYLSWPSELAARLSVCPLLPTAGADAPPDVDVVALELAAVLGVEAAGVLELAAGVLELLEPQPAHASGRASASSVTNAARAGEVPPGSTLP
jgi:hypothetical protein